MENGNETLERILSNIEHLHVKGGTGTQFKGGPQDVVQDSRYLEREKHQYKIYFKNIASAIKEADAIVIFGPAQTNEKFSKELHKNHIELSNKIKGVKKVDSMTDNQVKALVRDFFKAM